jgi:cytochrome c nitrite reductase small subunit
MAKVTLIIALCLVAGLAIGLGSFTFIYGKGYSYFSDNPAACVNCHIMHEQYDSWSKSAHSEVATCNSCHTPENFFFKAFSKAENGFNHSWKFTTGRFKEPLRIRQHNFDITISACLKCHATLMSNSLHQQPLAEGRSCLHCHREVGHTH